MGEEKIEKFGVHLVMPAAPAATPGLPVSCSTSITRFQFPSWAGLPATHCSTCLFGMRTVEEAGMFQTHGLIRFGSESGSVAQNRSQPCFASALVGSWSASCCIPK